ncbi:pilus assembly protein TadG-related protein [Ruegeria sp.]|uniref:TadE/TadG family type IV pilus assembly protein n=1 Tax=Ruegeria sp. TaxID=1879320 RepID=UPI003B595778
MTSHFMFRGNKKNIGKVFSAKRFARDEDGGVFTIFVLLGFIVILTVTGLGVDLMNYERDRANLQATLDRAVLAAADLDQTLPPREVVEAYLDKAGLGDKLATVTVEESIGSRKVSATADVVVKTHYMYFTGRKQLNAIAASTAEESIGKVEISLVLDMSGSMGRASATAGKTKMEVLREEAKEFVTLMMEKAQDSEVSISIVPYAMQVNAGENILGKFSNVTSEHSYSHCVNFRSDDFLQAALHPNPAILGLAGTTLNRTAHFDPFRYNGGEQFPRYPVCPTRTGSEITPVTNDVDVLHSQIDALTSGGNTSIDIGVKWGAALLDPAFRGLVGELSGEGIVPAEFSARPESYDADVIKVMVVMTDGQNTTQYILDEEFRSGNSNVWFNPEYDRGDGKFGEYSVRYARNPDRWVWMQHTEANGGSYVTATHPFGNPPDENSSNEEIGTSTRLTYPELHNLASTWWNAKNNYYWQNNHENTWHYNTRTSVGSTTKNTRLEQVCGAAKNQGVVIFGIAFEAPEAGFSEILSCATAGTNGTSYAFDVEGSDLEEAFTSIASSIQKLRLTQ